MAAFVGLLMAKLNSGDEVIFFDECYHRSREFCNKHLSRFGVVTRQVPACDYEAMEAAITPRTRLLISESPTNPHLSVVDIERFVAIGRRRGVETLIDATLGTPYNLRPLAAGVDYVLHSATKYLAGHNDLLAGVIVGGREKLDAVRKLRGIMGAINSPHNMYLLERGLKTFGLRMQRHNENGLAVAQFLAQHPRIEKVYYPGLESHAYHEVARRTMRGFGGLVTFLVKDADWRQTAAIVDAARIPRIGPSLGGAESLIEQPLVMSYFRDVARRPPPLRHSRQHDPASLRLGASSGPDRRPGPGAQALTECVFPDARRRRPRADSRLPRLSLSATFSGLGRAAHAGHNLATLAMRSRRQAEAA